MSNLIQDKVLQRQRTANKRAKVLAWLRGEIYTTADVAATLLDIQRPAAWKTLSAMARDGLVRSERLPGGSSIIAVWGLTPHGAVAAREPGRDDFADLPYFETGRVSPFTIHHALATQRLRLALEAEGWADWQSEKECRRRGTAEGWLKVPDALARDPAGQRVALEVERSFKTAKRYADVLSAYLRMVKQGQIDRIAYHCPPGMARHLQELFHSIDSVMFQGQRVGITSEHHARFSFQDLPRS